jgi:hypothetical protein
MGLTLATSATERHRVSCDGRGVGVGETPPFALYLGFRIHRGNRRSVCFCYHAHIVGLIEAP